MKVFISWSGELSNKVAMELRDCIPYIIQGVEPYVSSMDIDKGARWSKDIAVELTNSQFGIICVTPDNINSAWLNFEAGALSKMLDQSHVCPFLFGLKTSAIEGPLLQFQATVFEKNDFLKLMKTINNCCEVGKLEEVKLEKTFERWWPEIEEKIKSITIPDKKSSQKENITVKMIEEILDLTRIQQKMLSRPEELLPPQYVRQIVSEVSQMPSINDIDPDAIRALRKIYSELRKTVRRIQENGLPDENILAINEKVRELGAPIEYITRRVDSSRHFIQSKNASLFPLIKGEGPD